jgi:hypothetical protein
MDLFLVFFRHGFVKNFFMIKIVFSFEESNNGKSEAKSSTAEA